MEIRKLEIDPREASERPIIVKEKPVNNLNKKRTLLAYAQLG